MAPPNGLREYCGEYNDAATATGLFAWPGNVAYIRPGHKRPISKIAHTSSWIKTTVADAKPSITIEYDETFDKRTVNMGVFCEYITRLEEYITEYKIIVEKVRVSISSESDAIKEIVFDIYVDAGADSAMPFWDFIDEKINRWLEKQSGSTKELVIDQFYTDVHWK